MKSEKGITLISVTIYVIVMSIVVGVMAIISTFFFNNIKKNNSQLQGVTEYTKFNSFFTDEINHSGISILKCETTNDGESYVIFSNGVQYTYIPENKGIYRNKVKIARNITKCEFTEIEQNGKQRIKVVFNAGDKLRENTYTLKN